MITEFANLNPNSKLWIFQSNSFMTSLIQEKILDILTNFTANWESHGKLINSRFKIVKNAFLIVVADTNNESLCGSASDSLIREVKALNINMSTHFLNPMNTAYQELGEVKLCTLNDLKNLYVKKTINHNTLLYNNHISTLKELSTDWLVPLKNSWQTKFLSTS